MLRSRSWLRTLLVFPCAAALGCLTVNKQERDIDHTPVVTTGAGATIIYPGRSVPMPPPVHPKQVPYGQGAPGQPGSAPAPQGQGYPAQAPSGYVQPGTAGSSSQVPGYGGPEAGGGPVTPSGGGLTMIGGATTEETQHVTVDETPVYFKYLALPFAVAAAPFKYVADKMRGEHQPGPEIPTLENRPPQPPPVSRPATDYESRLLENMERELAQQPGQRPAAAPVAPATAPEPVVARARSGALSLEQELMLLRKHSAPAAPPVVASAPSVASSPPPAPSAEAAPPQPARTAPRSELDAASGQVDRNGDGRTDQWIFREGGEIARELYDEDFDGRPDRTLLYDVSRHEVNAIEEDADHDGRTDTWMGIQNGQVQRRRVDENGDGQVDTWGSYSGGELSRLERDTNGDGFRDRLSYYTAGRLEREEEDDDGDGRAEAIRYYDANEQVVRLEEDSDGDGKVDVVSHYEGGRLRSREILDAKVLQDGRAAEKL
jgi:hypothetical protein